MQGDTQSVFVQECGCLVWALTEIIIPHTLRWICRSIALKTLRIIVHDQRFGGDSGGENIDVPQEFRGNMTSSAWPHPVTLTLLQLITEQLAARHSTAHRTWDY